MLRSMSGVLYNITYQLTNAISPARVAYGQSTGNLQYRRTGFDSDGNVSVSFKHTNKLKQKQSNDSDTTNEKTTPIYGIIGFSIVLSNDNDG